VVTILYSTSSLHPSISRRPRHFDEISGVRQRDHRGEVQIYVVVSEHVRKHHLLIGISNNFHFLVDFRDLREDLPVIGDEIDDFAGAFELSLETSPATSYHHQHLQSCS
jgi:hypothetical protein